jgi:hypothetical protein
MFCLTFIRAYFLIDGGKKANGYSKTISMQTHHAVVDHNVGMRLGFRGVGLFSGFGGSRAFRVGGPIRARPLLSWYRF